MKKILKWLDNYLEYTIITFFTSVMLIVMFAQVVIRFIFNGNLAWTEEIAMYSMVWLCYFASSLAVKNRSHLKVEIVTVFLKPKAQKLFDMFSLFMFFLFSCFVLYFCTLLTVDVLQRGQVTAVLGIPKWICYAGVPLGFLTTIIRMIQDFKKLFQEYKELCAQDLAKVE